MTSVFLFSCITFFLVVNYGICQSQDSALPTCSCPATSRGLRGLQGVAGLDGRITVLVDEFELQHIFKVILFDTIFGDSCNSDSLKQLIGSILNELVEEELFSERRDELRFFFDNKFILEEDEAIKMDAGIFLSKSVVDEEICKVKSEERLEKRHIFSLVLEELEKKHDKINVRKMYIWLSCILFHEYTSQKTAFATTDSNVNIGQLREKINIHFKIDPVTRSYPEIDEKIIDDIAKEISLGNDLAAVNRLLRTTYIKCQANNMMKKMVEELPKPTGSVTLKIC
ncbi:hypothetical protein HZS_3451 [Henneguya salminicola]|nr:hypothetical protein HZS_3451 [Henneguya salminicola]